MRIIDTIQHPRLKISVFKNGGRFSVKFEDGMIEQTYKFDERQGVTTLDGVKKMIDSAFIKKVEIGLNEMKKLHLDTLLRNAPQELPNEFEEII